MYKKSNEAKRTDPLAEGQILANGERLLINRNGLDILIHPNTGTSLEDHTNHALWLGNKLTLRLGELDDAN